MVSTTVNSPKQVALPLKKVFSKLALGLTTLLLAAAAIFSVTTTTTLADEIDDYISRYQPAIETLHGLQVDERTVTIVVTSTGCTKKQDFIVVSDKSQPPTVTFSRLIPDYCKAAPSPYPIKFSLEEIGAKEFKVANTVDPMPRW